MRTVALSRGKAIVGKTGERRDMLLKRLPGVALGKIEDHR